MNDMAGRGDDDHKKWLAVAKKMAVKRDMNKKRKSMKDFRRDRTSVENDFITVQRLSASVAGKAQKFCRVGNREFAPALMHFCTSTLFPAPTPINYTPFDSCR